MRTSILLTLNCWLKPTIHGTFRCELGSDGHHYAQNHKCMMEISSDSRQFEIYILSNKIQWQQSLYTKLLSVWWSSQASLHTQPTHNPRQSQSVLPHPSCKYCDRPRSVWSHNYHKVNHVLVHEYSRQSQWRHRQRSSLGVWWTLQATDTSDDRWWSSLAPIAGDHYWVSAIRLSGLRLRMYYHKYCQTYSGIYACTTGHAFGRIL